MMSIIALTHQNEWHGPYQSNMQNSVVDSVYGCVMSYGQVAFTTLHMCEHKASMLKQISRLGYIDTIQSEMYYL